MLNGDEPVLLLQFYGLISPGRELTKKIYTTKGAQKSDTPNDL